MKLILHIGTHKTGTSALQKFLHINRNRLLEQEGIYYASRSGSKNANFLAKELVAGNYSMVRDFFADGLLKAEAAGARIMLISAESFYVMAAFYLLLKGKPCGDSWEAERQAVELLQSTIPKNLDIQVVCYFRRPDQFLESIYNQIIKATRYSGSIDEFLEVMKPALDYAKQIQLWQQVFGQENCKVYGYENAGQDIVSDFLLKTLGVDDFGDYEKKELRLNSRLSRDVLEFKRILNKIPASRAHLDMNKHSSVLLTNQLGDDGRYHDYLLPEKRSQLLKELNPMLELVESQFGVRFAEIKGKCEATYSGFSTETATEILFRYEMIQSGIRFRFEKAMLNIAYSIRKRNMRFNWVLKLGKMMNIRKFMSRE